MTPGEAYLEYLAITRHFASDYDYFKFRGKIREPKRSTFDARPDRWMFDKLSRKHDARWMIIGSCLAGKKWIGDMIGEEAEEIAAKRMKNVQSLAYVVRNDLDKLLDDFDANIVVPEGQLPHAVAQTLAGEVQVETLAAIVGLTGCHSYWMSVDDPVLQAAARTAWKYHPFMEMDREKIRRLVVDRRTAKAV